jgi:hypothetical protein
LIVGFHQTLVNPKKTMSSQNTTQSEVSSDGTDSFSFKLYRYDPSLAAAIVAVALFTIISFYHVWLMKRHRSWYFTAFIIGGFCKRLLLIHIFPY